MSISPPKVVKDVSTLVLPFYTLSSETKQVLRMSWGLERSACDPKCFYSVCAFELCKEDVKGEWGGGFPLLTERGDLWQTLWCAAQLPLPEWRLLFLLLAVSSWLKSPSGPLALQSCLPKVIYIFCQHRSGKVTLALEFSMGLAQVITSNASPFSFPSCPHFPSISSLPHMLTPEVPPNSSSTCQSLSQPLVLRESTCDAPFGVSSFGPLATSGFEHVVCSSPEHTHFIACGHCTPANWSYLFVAHWW